MTATNICSNFGGFRCSLPLAQIRLYANVSMELLRSSSGHISQFEKQVFNMQSATNHRSSLNFVFYSYT